MRNFLLLSYIIHKKRKNDNCYICTIPIMFYYRIQKTFPLSYKNVRIVGVVTGVAEESANKKEESLLFQVFEKELCKFDEEYHTDE